MAKISKSKQDEQINAEINKIMGLLKDISEDKRELVIRLVERVAFMTITLQILEEEIKSKGPVCNFEQGKQKMVIENPAQKSYNTMINRYTAAYEKLLSLLPKDSGAGEEDDGFEDFINSRAD